MPGGRNRMSTPRPCSKSAPPWKTASRSAPPPPPSCPRPRRDGSRNKTEGPFLRVKIKPPSKKGNRLKIASSKSRSFLLLFALLLNESIKGGPVQTSDSGSPRPGHRPGAPARERRGDGRRGRGPSRREGR